MDPHATLAFRPSPADQATTCPEMPLLFSCGVASLAFLFGIALGQAAADAWELGPSARTFLLAALSVGFALAAGLAVQPPLSLVFQSGATAWRRALGDAPERRCLSLAAAALDAFPHLRSLPEGSLWHVTWFAYAGEDIARALSLEVHTPDGRVLDVPISHPHLAPLAALPCPRSAHTHRPTVGITFSMRMPTPSAHLRLALHQAAQRTAPRRAPFWQKAARAIRQPSLS